jgi:uncharacterized membrane protein YphA (DoxX/SURF4 family)
MLDINSFSSRWTAQLLSILRIMTALLFMQHGLQKLFGIPAAPPTGTPPFDVTLRTRRHA